MTLVIVLLGFGLLAFIVSRQMQASAAGPTMEQGGTSTPPPATTPASAELNRPVVAGKLVSGPLMQDGRFFAKPIERPTVAGKPVSGPLLPGGGFYKNQPEPEQARREPGWVVGFVKRIAPTSPEYAKLTPAERKARLLQGFLVVPW